MPSIQQVPGIINTLENQNPDSITRNYGLRDKVKEIVNKENTFKDQIANASSLEQLAKIVQNYKGQLTTSDGQLLSSNYKTILAAFLESKSDDPLSVPLFKITSNYGLLQKMNSLSYSTN